MMNNIITFTYHNGLLINSAYVDILKAFGIDSFNSLIEYEDISVLKEKKPRSIVKIDKKGKTFYLKKHVWPLIERIKSILPLVRKEDAENEWSNILLLHELGFQTMTPVAFGEKKRIGLPFLSLTLTEHLYDAEKLESFLPRYFAPPLSKERMAEKRKLIRKLSELSQKLHDHGINHQDFYLGHIFIRPTDNAFFIIDLQRMHQNRRISRNDRIKDLAQLAYSATVAGVFTRTDFMRFALAYFDSNSLIGDDRRLVRRIMAKMRRIVRHDAKLQQRKADRKP